MSASQTTTEITATLADLAGRVETAMEQWVASPGVPTELAEAMRYAVLGGGKRLRPALVLLSAKAVCEGAPPATDPMPAAVALELVHTYSLVHDDLPAMDDDALRRGRPTVHVKCGEAMAILVGDALLTRAFAILAEMIDDPKTAVALTAELARAAGPSGMIAGQVADMALCTFPEGAAGLEYIHQRKTAAMFAAACSMGAICGGADAPTRSTLAAFGSDLGLAFQITDDLLDTTATSEQLGKTAGKDAAAGKRTYPALLGPAESALAAEQASGRATGRLDTLGSAADSLRSIVEMLLARKN